MKDTVNCSRTTIIIIIIITAATTRIKRRKSASITAADAVTSLPIIDIDWQLRQMQAVSLDSTTLQLAPSTLQARPRLAQLVMAQQNNQCTLATLLQPLQEEC